MAGLPGHLPHLEATAEFLLRLRARGVRDLTVLRAMEAVPRDIFVPSRYAAVAAKDIALPLPCGQTMSEPFLVARMMEALGVTAACRILEIGSGSGYATAILARLGREVVGVERFRSLAIHAKTRLLALGATNASVVWGDGLAMPPDSGPFDRIVIHAELAGVPADLASLLAPEGTLVCARRAEDDGGRQSLVRCRRDPAGPWVFDPVTPSRLRGLYDGPSLGL